MNLTVALVCFPVVFLGELPDKTMFASLVLATRGRPLLVWLGAAAAFAVHVAIAVTVGVTVFHLVPRRAVDAVAASLFLAGAVYAWRGRHRLPPDVLPEAAPGAGNRAASAGAHPTEAAVTGELAGAGAGTGASETKGGGPDDGSAGTGRRSAGSPGRHGTVATAFVVVFVAEWGDLTQVLTADLAARYHAPVAVGAGSLAALLVVAALAVTGARFVTRFVSMDVVGRVTAAVLLVLAGTTAWMAAR